MARILLVEDVPANRVLMAKLLKAAGHQVLQAVDGASGLALAQTSRPDLILMDLSLPGIDGWETLRRLRGDRATSDTPVVCVTAHAMVGDRERAVAAGFDGYMSKPIETMSFARTVETYLRPMPDQKP
jgi:two-component system cell cycle response regulator